jgi:hypothetical protein
MSDNIRITIVGGKGMLTQLRGKAVFFDQDRCVRVRGYCNIIPMLMDRALDDRSIGRALRAGYDAPTEVDFDGPRARDYADAVCIPHRLRLSSLYDLEHYCCLPTSFWVLAQDWRAPQRSPAAWC